MTTGMELVPASHRNYLTMPQSAADRINNLVQNVMAAKSLSYSKNGKNLLSEYDIKLKLLKGIEIGLPPMAALSNLDIIYGTPTLNAKGMMKLILKSGLLEDMKITDDGHTCSVTMKRVGIKTPHIETFSLDDAMKIETNEHGKDIPLAEKSNWKQRPKLMRKNSAIKACALTLFGDVIDGLDIEVSEYDDPEPDYEIETSAADDGDVIDSAPEPEPVGARRALPDENPQPPTEATPIQDAQVITDEPVIEETPTPDPQPEPVEAIRESPNNDPTPPSTWTQDQVEGVLGYWKKQGLDEETILSYAGITDKNDLAQWAKYETHTVASGAIQRAFNQQTAKTETPAPEPTPKWTPGQINSFHQRFTDTFPEADLESLLGELQVKTTQALGTPDQAWTKITNCAFERGEGILLDTVSNIANGPEPKPDAKTGKVKDKRKKFLSFPSEYGELRFYGGRTKFGEVIGDDNYFEQSGIKTLEPNTDALSIPPLLATASQENGYKKVKSVRSLLPTSNNSESLEEFLNKV